MKKILVVGSSNIDFVLQVDTMPRKGETIHTTAFHKIPGGKGANQACACARLGGDCTFLSAVGRDGMGEAVMNGLKEAGVDVSRVHYDKAEPTGMAIIAVNSDGDNSIMIVPGANNLCNAVYFQENQDCIDAADIIMTQLETPARDIYNLLEAAKKAGKLTVLNPAPAPDKIPDWVLCGLDFLTPNETELETIAGMKTETVQEIGAAAKTLLAKGVRNVLVTIGPRGALLCNAAGCEVFPTINTKRVDTTAAGDTFSAGFAVGLAEGKTLRECIALANAAAAVSITRKGAQTSIPTRKEVEELLCRAKPCGNSQLPDYFLDKEVNHEVRQIVKPGDYC